MQPERLAEVELSVQDFFRHDHRVIYGALQEMIGRHQTVDLITLSEHLRQANLLEEAGGIPYLATIMRETLSASNVAVYAEIVKARSTSRRAVEIAMKLQAGSMGEDSGAVDEAVRALMDLSVMSGDHSVLVKDALGPVLEEIDARVKGEAPPTIKTGLKRLDEAIGGFYPGDLIVVAARTSTGKTSWGTGILLANQGIPSGFMSMEQPTNQIVSRMIASIGGVNAHALRLGRLDNEDYQKIDRATRALYDIPMYINDRSSPPIADILRQARKWKYEHGIQILLVDYLQRIAAGRDSRREDRRLQIEEFVRELKGIARELNITVIALCQVNRGVESRSDRRPRMSDLSESGAIENEADLIITLYRPELYEEDQRQKGVAEVSVIKNRHGPLGKVTCRFNGAFIRYEDQPAEFCD